MDDDYMDTECSHCNLFLWNCKIGLKDCETCQSNTAPHMYRHKIKPEEEPSSWPPKHITNTEYRMAALSCGIKIGDLVKVIRKLPCNRNDLYGWSNCWMPGMDKAMGNTYSVTDIYANGDFSLNYRTEPHCGAYTFPYFVLKKVY
jgi:hypothetical protein